MPAPLDDFASYAAMLEVERGIGELGAVGIEFSWCVRDFATRGQAAVGGRPLFGTHLRISRPSAGIWHEIRGRAEFAWRVRTRLRVRANDDNGSGWYDYHQCSAGLSASLEARAWSWTADLDWDGSLYRVQTVGFGNPPRRTLNNWMLALRGERALSARWSGIVEGEFELSRSNDPFQTYDDMLLLIGLRWSR